MRIEEADGTKEMLDGWCIKDGCGFRREYRVWIDPFENMNHGDLMHDIIFGFTRPGETQ